MKIIYTLIFLSLFALCANAQWQHTSGPTGNGGNNVFCMLARGTDLFAGTQEEIYLTHDSGATWILDTAGFNIIGSTTYGISSLCTVGNSIIASQGDNYYRSSDNGLSWANVGN